MSAPAVVLVVDDDPDVRAGLAESLQEAGYRAVTAPGGAQALGMLRAGLAPALVLLDLMMPGMDGEAFCRACRADPRLRGTRVVVLSADADALRRAAACGASGWAAKPLHLAELLALVAAHARR